MNDDRSAWPRLDYAAWRDTGATLHRWTQIVGKVRLAVTFQEVVHPSVI